MDEAMADSAPEHSDRRQSCTSLARELCRTMADIHRRGWCDGSGGNFSVVLRFPPDLRLLMAPSGVDKGRVRPNQLIEVTAEGDVVRGEGRVSAEMALHRTIVEQAGAGAVLHTHSQAGTLLSKQVGCGELTIEGLEMLKGLQGITTHQSTICIPVLPNDQDLQRLSEAAGPLLQNAPYGILIAGHGLYAWGNQLDQARRHLEILEFLLEQTWRQRLMEAMTDRQP